MGHKGWQEALDWLLEADEANPGVRYFALKELLELPEDDPEVAAARRALMNSGPAPVILEAQAGEGYWVKPGPGYDPKYKGTVWQIIFLAQFGADGSDERVRRGCQYVLSHTRSKTDRFSMTATPGGTIQCLEGNLGAALIDLGWLGDERLETALDRLARSITEEGFSSDRLGLGDRPGLSYLRSGNCAPLFACSGNNRLPCAWGAVKALIALGKVPESKRTGAIKRAIEVGVDFLLSHDVATAAYPTGFSSKPSGNWFKFGYPLAYVTDVLQSLEALMALGCGRDSRLSSALDLLLSKQDKKGRWKIEYSYNGKMWVDVEDKGQASKWVTLRALRVLKRADQA